MAFLKLLLHFSFTAWSLWEMIFQYPFSWPLAGIRWHLIKISRKCRSEQIYLFIYLFRKQKAVELELFILHLYLMEYHTYLQDLQTLWATFVVFWMEFYNKRKKQRQNMKAVKVIKHLKATHGTRFSLPFYYEVWNSSSPMLFTQHCLNN